MGWDPPLCPTPTPSLLGEQVGKVLLPIEPCILSSKRHPLLMGCCRRDGADLPKLNTLTLLIVHHGVLNSEHLCKHVWPE